MEGCLYNGLENLSLKDYLKKEGKSSCLSCEYKFPCNNFEKSSESKVMGLMDKANLERRVEDNRIIHAHIKSGYYQIANL